MDDPTHTDIGSIGFTPSSIEIYRWLLFDRFDTGIHIILHPQDKQRIHASVIHSRRIVCNLLHPSWCTERQRLRSVGIESRLSRLGDTHYHKKHQGDRDYKQPESNSGRSHRFIQTVLSMLGMEIKNSSAPFARSISFRSLENAKGSSTEFYAT